MINFGNASRKAATTIGSVSGLKDVLHVDSEKPLGLLSVSALVTACGAESVLFSASGCVTPDFNFDALEEEYSFVDLGSSSTT